jgi:hypothetical protein
MKSPHEMTSGQINKELDALDATSSAITREFIEAGRGSERPSETIQKTDPLSARWKVASDRVMALHNEIERRYGPGAPRRLPPRWGKKK